MPGVYRDKRHYYFGKPIVSEPAIFRLGHRAVRGLLGQGALPPGRAHPCSDGRTMRRRIHHADCLLQVSNRLGPSRYVSSHPARKLPGFRCGRAAVASRTACWCYFAASAINGSSAGVIWSICHRTRRRSSSAISTRINRHSWIPRYHFKWPMRGFAAAKPAFSTATCPGRRLPGRWDSLRKEGLWLVG